MRRGSAPRRRRALPAALGLAGLLGVPACARRGPSSEAVSVSVPYEVDDLDPHRRDRLSTFAVGVHFYEPLVTTDANLAIHPCLATRWDNPDLSTWVFHLRPGVRFHDGRELKAADVVATFRRLLESRHLAVAGYLHDVTAVRALDESTVELKTRTPTSTLLNKLRFVLIAPAGREDLDRSAVGTGPYRLVSFTPDREIRMARNDAWWGPRPAMKEVTFRLARRPQEALSDLAEGRSDLVQADTRAAEDVARRLPDVVLRKENGIFVKFLGFDLSHEAAPSCPGPGNPFLERKVREAMSLAIDRRALVARLSTFAIPSWQTVPPSIFGYDPRLPETPHDPERARRLLAEAGLPGGFTVTLHARRLFEEAVPPIVEMLGKVGIRVVPELHSDEEYFRRVSREHAACFFLSRFGCATGDVSDLLDNGMHSRDEERHFGEQNDGGFSDRDVDRRIEESAATLDTERRRQLLNTLVSDLTGRIVWLPLYVDQTVFLYRRRLSYRPRSDELVVATDIGSSDAAR